MFIYQRVDEHAMTPCDIPIRNIQELHIPSPFPVLPWPEASVRQARASSQLPGTQTSRRNRGGDWELQGIL